MTINLNAQSHQGHLLPAQLEPPDTCPMCHHGVNPQFLTAIWSMERQWLKAAFRCPRNGCQEMFVGTYRDENNTSIDWKLVALAPYTTVYPKYPEPITKISPRFVEIMKQVTVADAKDLDDLVGMGLRKALEFLIKDLTIHENPGQKENIEKGELAWVIGQYIKVCARRATWLGNDETHFLRIWKDKDVADLKRLVQLTVNWIESHELTKEYQKDMPQPEKKGRQ